MLVEVIVLVVVSILMLTSQSEAVGEAGWGEGGGSCCCGNPQVHWEVWLSTSQFPTCASNLSGETWYSAIISKQTGEISQVQVDGLGLNLAIFTPMF